MEHELVRADPDVVAVIQGRRVNSHSVDESSTRAVHILNIPFT